MPHEDTTSEIRPPAPLSPWKRVLDVACSTAALPLLALVTAGVAGVMALSAPGPVYYLQDGVGCRGRRVRLYRFRTMRLSSGGRAPTVSIPGGRFLRASGLSELPQIVNVLRGEISVFGPRPVALPHAPTALGFPRPKLPLGPG